MLIKYLQVISVIAIFQLRYLQALYPRFIQSQ